MRTHYEVLVQTLPKFNNHFNMVHYHNIYRVVQMAGGDVIEIVRTFDSPNGGWNWEQAMRLLDDLREGQGVG